MTQVNTETLKSFIPIAQKAIEAGGATPEWLKTAEKITTNINEMLKVYTDIKGGGKQEIMRNDKPQFIPHSSENRVIEPIPVVSPPNNDFKELLAGIIKTCDTLSGMGNGDRKIGEVIMALPFTVNQTKEFLTRLYQQKFGV